MNYQGLLTLSKTQKSKRFFSLSNVDEITPEDVSELVPVAEPSVEINVNAEEVEVNENGEELVEGNPTAQAELPTDPTTTADAPDVSKVEENSPNGINYETPEGGDDNGEEMPPAKKDGSAPEESLSPYMKAVLLKLDLIKLAKAKKVVEKHGMTKSLHALLNENYELSRAMGYDNVNLTAERFIAGVNTLFAQVKKSKLFK